MHPSGQNPDRILGALRSYVGRLTTAGVTVELEPLISSSAVVSASDGPGVSALSRSLEAEFGNRAAHLWNGSTLPVAEALVAHLGGELVGAGITQPGALAMHPTSTCRLSNFMSGSAL